MESSIDLEEFWEDLLAFIEERRVIPIIGADLSALPDGTTLQHKLAKGLAERLKLPGWESDQAAGGLNEVVCAFLARHGRREDIYPKLRALMKEVQMAPPAVLRSLANITDFDLYVTLGFDALLVDAIDEARFEGRKQTQHIGYAPHRPIDLPSPREKLADPVVYALLGRVSAAPDYVITDEDMLEFLSALQSDSRRPHLLFDALQSSHLLMIGCTFPDWLSRIFIRIAKNRPLSMQRGEAEFVIDDRLAKDASLIVFLEHFSYGTRVLPLEPTAFVAELEQRWAKRRRSQQPARAAVRDVDQPEASAAIFLSYSREDSEAAVRLYEHLDALGLDVWFDRDRLEGGDAYEQKIRRQIRSCALFLPLVSRRTERRVEGFFRREWKMADERVRGIADHVPFILPVATDDVSSSSDGVPDSFKRVHWTRLAEGRPTSEFEVRIVQLVREHRKRERGLS